VGTSAIVGVTLVDVVAKGALHVVKDDTTQSVEVGGLEGSVGAAGDCVQLIFVQTGADSDRKSDGAEIIAKAFAWRCNVVLQSYWMRLTNA